MLNKIFISLACYRDPEIIPTIRDAYNKAQNKHLIVFGIYAQMAPTDNKIDLSFIEDKEQIRLLIRDNTKARGPSYARYIIYNKLYKDEIYYLQIDSHTRFVENWDTELIAMHSKLSANSVISTYPKGYQLNHDIILAKSDRMNILKFKKIKDGIPIFNTISIPQEDKPKRNYFWAAGYSFCYGAIFKIIPFDPHLKNLFWGEEFLMSLRFFTNNIKIYSPNRHIIYTLWTRNYRHTFWELKEKMNGKFETYGFLSFLRLCSIANFFPYNFRFFEKLEPKFKDEIEKYGIGNKKSVEDFYNRIGIKDNIKKEDYNKIIQKIYFSLKINL
jgi:[Skp1-protein]-hydroxyproline N-acetylglucosaminyltransferase